MGCLFGMFAAFVPRLATLFIWLARPALFVAPFGGLWILPVLGIIFLPMTMLFYAILWDPVFGIGPFDWFWLFLAFLLDVTAYGFAGYANRDRLAY